MEFVDKPLHVITLKDKAEQNRFAEEYRVKGKVAR